MIAPTRPPASPVVSSIPGAFADPTNGWQPARIAVLRALKLGDLLCATPALRALRRRFPAAEITLIGLPWAEDLVRRLPALDRLAAFPGYPGIPEAEAPPARTAAFLDAARAYHYDLAIQMHGDGNVSNGFVDALGAPVTLGYRRLDDDRLTLGLPYVADEPEVIRWLRLVGLLGAPVVDRRLAFPVTSAETGRAEDVLRDAPPGDGPLVGLHPGASDPHRRWPAARFAALATAVHERWRARLVLTGGAGERDLTDEIASRVPALDLAGRTSLGDLAAVIGRLDLLVTNDTGASHLAAAAGTRSVVIFGSTSPRQWAPLDLDRHFAVDARTFASPYLSGVEALARLPLEPVLAACARHLERNRPGFYARPAAPETVTRR